jgi:tetratricopeptide (TPR) repeat protein
LPAQAEGEFALVREKLEPALQLSGQPVKRGTMAHEHIVYMMLVDAAAQVEDGATIRKFGPKLEELALRDDHQPYLAVAHRAWGIAHRLAGEYQEAGERLSKALHIFESLETRWQVGRTLFELGELSLAQTEGEAAHGYFTRAQELFEELGAKPDLTRVAAVIARLN